MSPGSTFISSLVPLPSTSAPITDPWPFQAPLSLMAFISDDCSFCLEHFPWDSLAKPYLPGKTHPEYHLLKEALLDHPSMIQAVGCCVPTAFTPCHSSWPHPLPLALDSELLEASFSPVSCGKG